MIHSRSILFITYCYSRYSSKRRKTFTISKQERDGGSRDLLVGWHTWITYVCDVQVYQPYMSVTSKNVHKIQVSKKVIYKYLHDKFMRERRKNVFFSTFGFEFKASEILLVTYIQFDTSRAVYV